MSIQTRQIKRVRSFDMRGRERGFTLVELLVVIAIIGILVSLLLPAVNAAREAARRSQCSNHLKQIGLAFVNHEATHKFLPSNGWSLFSVGDPDRGFGRAQPGGWAYSILPFIEEQAVFDLPGDGDRQRVTPQQRMKALELLASPVSSYYCPSRRPSGVYPYVLPNQWSPWNSDKPDFVARTDYGVNGGDTTDGAHSFATEFEVRPDGTWEYIQYQDFFWPGSYVFADRATFAWPPESGQSGISFFGSEIALTKVKDGLTKTYMVGERFMNSDHYDSGLNPNDNVHCYVGSDWDINVYGNADPQFTPRQDQRGSGDFGGYGSSHPGVFHAVMCDGSVASIPFGIDLRVHTLLSHRRDTQTLDDTPF